MVRRWSYTENCEVDLTPDDYEDCSCGECFICEYEDNDWEDDWDES